MLALGVRHFLVAGGVVTAHLVALVPFVKEMLDLMRLQLFRVGQFGGNILTGVLVPRISSQAQYMARLEKGTNS